MMMIAHEAKILTERRNVYRWLFRLVTE